MQIKKRHIVLPKAGSAQDLRSKAGYKWIALHDYLKDSRLSYLGITPQCIAAISNWATESLNEAPVAEVGGFLLGRYGIYEGERTFVSVIDHFLPAMEVEYQDAMQLSFGAQPLIEVDNFLGQHPELCLVGWFHTHPGHTPYLSDMDLQIHEGFFQAPYQVAIVLDSLTQDFDTGIFSRKASGLMNNKPDYLQWFRWKPWQKENNA